MVDTFTLAKKSDKRYGLQEMDKLRHLPVDEVHGRIAANLGVTRAQVLKALKLARDDFSSSAPKI